MNAQQILDRLDALVPQFGEFWADPDNLFRDDDGSFTRCGVFATFSHFFRDNYIHFSPSQLAEIGRFLSECLDASDAEMSEAAATCFLENVSGEPFSREFQQHLSGEALQYYLHWNNPS